MINNVTYLSCDFCRFVSDLRQYT